MKRRMLTLLIAVLIFASIPISAFGNTSRILAIWPGLSFSGTEATCSLQVTADYPTDKIQVVLKLWDNNICVKTWYLSGTFTLSFSDTYNAVRNHEYTLTADVQINGVSKPRVSFTGKCE